MEELNGKNNPRIKEAQKLLDRKERKAAGKFLLEGARLCCDAAYNGVKIETLFITAQAAGRYPDEFALLSSKARNSFYVSEENAAKLSDTDNSQNIFCVCEKKEETPVINAGGMYVLLDNIQTPDNLGAIVRTAEALGADGLIVCSGCDVYSPKAMRAAMGALLRFPVITGMNAPEAVRLCREKGMRVFAAVPDRSAEDISAADKKGGAVIVIGNEGNGVGSETLSECTGAVTIPMKGKAESLNAAAAAAIAVWEFMKER